MGRGPTKDSFSEHEAFNSDQAFEDRYRAAANTDSPRYAIFHHARGIVEWIQPMPERGSWSAWLEQETDKDVKRKIQYPDCLKEDQDALEDLLEIVKMS